MGTKGAEGPAGGTSGAGGGAAREAKDSWEGVGEDFCSALYFVRMSCWKENSLGNKGEMG